MSFGKKYLYNGEAGISPIHMLILIVFFNSLSVQGQSAEEAIQKKAEPKRTLTLKDCLLIAAENNHRLKAAGYSVQISESKKKQAESANWPQLTLKAAYSLTDQDPVFAIPSFKMSLPQMNLGGMALSLPDFEVPRQDIKMMDRQNIHALLEMTFPLYTGGKIQALNEQALQGIEISRQDHRKTRLEIQYDVTRYYYSVLLSRKIYDIASSTLERLEMTLKLTESTYKNGSGKTTKLDYLKNKVIVDQVRSIVSEMKKNVSLSKEALAFTLGIKSDFDVPDEEIPFIKFRTELAAAESPVHNRNADLGKINAALLYYQAKVDEAYSGFMPKVGIAGTFAQNINSYKSGISNNTNAQMWMLSLGVEIPLFEGYRTSNEVSEARINLNKAEEEKKLLQDAISLQVKEARQRIETAEENVNNAMQAKLTATENRSLNERAFQQEMAEAKDLIEAQIMESIMEVQYLKSLYDHAEAEAYLDLLTGNELLSNEPMVEK